MTSTVINEVYEASSPIEGFGIFAARDFGEGDRVIAIEDEVVPPPWLARDASDRRLYYDDLSDGRVSQLGPLQYTNHNCDFTVYTKTIDGVRYRIARRDIRAGEEITSHYSINARGGGVWQRACGSSACLGRITHDFFAPPRQLQVTYVDLLDDWFIAENAEDVARVREWKTS